MKRKILIVCLTFLLMIPCVIFLNGCGEKPYNVELSKSINENGFEMKVTDDFALYDNDENENYVKSNNDIILVSEGDGEICFNRSTITGKITYGNKYYDIATDLNKYIQDIFRLEKLSSGEFENFTFKQRVSVDELKDVNSKLYIINEKTNPNGNWDYYKILIFGKTESYFVNFEFSTSIENKNLGKWTKKCKTIASSIILNQKIENKTYDQSVTNEISQKIVTTGNALNDFGMVLKLPDTYSIIQNEVPGNNYVATKYSLEAKWSSSISFSSLASFMGVNYTDQYGVENLISCSSDDVLGYYLKGELLNSDQSISTVYYIYFIDENNNLMQYTMRVYVGCSEELESLGFKNYFEEQLIEWLHNMEFVQI